MKSIKDLSKRVFAPRGVKRPKEVDQINALEEELSALDEANLKEEGLSLRERAKAGESLDDLMPRAFALIREVSKRKSGQRHFDVQLWGGIVMHQSGIAEMMTGEGKTLAATAPVYLNALTGEGAHVVTVNDYLAKRDMAWMGQIYDALGLSVACLVHDAAYMYDPEWKLTEEEQIQIDKERDLKGSFEIKEEFLRPVTRREAYAADITYGTNHEFGFDYLRDNLRRSKDGQVQRPLNFAIVDEVDSILIDEARTPLIISFPDQGSSEYYRVFAEAVRHLREDEDYVVDEKLRSVEITEPGIDKIERMANIKDLYAPENLRLAHYLEACLKANSLYEKDKEYVVKEGQIILVDQFTGRLMPGRRYSGGLHQAIEAKEGVAVQDESRTFAQITIQNYFRLYKKLAGMTGTAQTSAEEFHKVYSMEVVSIPTNRSLIRDDRQDLIYKNLDAKYKAIVADVREKHEKGQPVLIGTVSIDKNEVLSSHLSKAGIPHEVLNAKNHEREGAIIAQAGKRGAVTVATNMAGRGVDIVLGGAPIDEERAKEIKDLGGLHVLGTERHEARRIDNQLRGRAGRQGDPGSSQFFLSLEDDLMRIFGGDRIKGIMERFDLPEDQPIQNKMVSNAIVQAQSKVEGFNFDARKHLLDYDDVINKQRLSFYDKRQKMLEALGGEGSVYIKEVLENSFNSQLEQLRAVEAPDDRKRLVLKEIGSPVDELDKVGELAKTHIDKMENIEAVGVQLLGMMDFLWMTHLENIESLRESVRIRAYGQKDPLVEYRRESRTLFDQLQASIDGWVFSHIFRIKTDVNTNNTGQEKPSITIDTSSNKVGRNDPCPCGSGKKYKKCHGG
ncbi:MAG: preprotein translocase subunit SecA [Candidatus Colwellbacteria bacterium]